MPSSTLQTAYVSLSDALFCLLTDPELPHSARSAIYDFSLELRTHLNAEQRQYLDAVELRATLPACLEALSQKSTNRNELEQGGGCR